MWIKILTFVDALGLANVTALRLHKNMYCHQYLKQDIRGKIAVQEILSMIAEKKQRRSESESQRLKRLHRFLLSKKSFEKSKISLIFQSEICTEEPAKL